MGMGKHGILLGASSGNLFTCFGKGSRAAGEGRAWALNLNKGLDATLVHVPIQGYPHQQALHAHGIYVSNATDRSGLVTIKFMSIMKSIILPNQIQYNNFNQKFAVFQYKL